jgi:mannosyltransferase
MQIKVHKEKLLYLYPLLLFLFNLIIRSIYLLSQDISYDEPLSIYYAQFRPNELTAYLKNHFNPPLFELILHYWIKLFGISPLSVRILPMLFASLAPVALFLTGKKYFGSRIGIASSLFLSCSTMLMYYSHDCRTYSLFILLSILSVNAFFEAFVRPGNNKVRYTIFIFISSLLIYSHYFGIILLLIEIIYFFTAIRKNVFNFFGCLVIIFLMYWPQLLPLFIHITTFRSRNIISPPSGPDDIYNKLWAFSNMPVVAVGCIAILVITFCYSIYRKKIISRSPIVTFTLWWFLLPLIGLYLFSFHIPLYLSKFLCFILPAYYILVCYCIIILVPSRLFQNIILGIAVIGFAITLDLDPPKNEHPERTVNMVKRLKQNGTVIVFVPYNFMSTFAYHYDRTIFASVFNGIEYATVDSLLRKENIFFEKDSTSLKKFDPERFENAVLTISGNYYFNKQTPSYHYLRSKFPKIRQFDINPNARMYVFNK